MFSQASRRGVVALVAAILASCPEPRDDGIYRYVDDGGRAVFVTGLAKVPSEHRDAAELVSGSANEGGASPEEDAGPAGGAPDVSEGAVVYRYAGPRGRPAFTNRRELVPPDQRAHVQVVDLSHVSTNRELGHDLDVALDREMERLAASKPCKNARAEVQAGRWRLLWRDEPHLVAVAGVLAALLFMTPWAVRRLGAPWLRVLAFAIPVLLLTGVLAHAMISVNRAMSDGIHMTELCDPAPSQAGVGDSPAAFRARVEQTDRLRAAVEAAVAGPDARIQEELAH